MRQRLQLVVSLAILGATSAALPLQMAVTYREKECFYETLAENESMTASIFVLNGEELKATVFLDGPVAPPEVQTGRALQDAVDAFESTGSNGEPEVVDFEHLNVSGEYLDEDEDPNVAGELLGILGKKDKSTLTPEERRDLKDMQRKKILLKRQKQDEQKRHQHSKVREEGQPFEKTIKASRAGWYRFCVKATQMQITAEIEIRKESELGGVDEEGDVLTYEDKSMQEEDKMLEEDTASEEGIKDEDFQGTKQKLKSLRRLLAEIQQAQQKERRRLVVHSATNKHSHSRMVLGSLLETVFFMAVTGYQVYTIRRWFRGAPALGR